MLEVRSAVSGVVFLRPVLVLCCTYDLEFLASGLQLSFFDEDVLLRRDQLYWQNHHQCRLLPTTSTN